MDRRRLGHLITLIGVALLILSSVKLSYGGDSISGRIDPNEAKGKIIGVSGTVEYSLTVEIDRMISIYVLDYENTMQFIETRDINNVSKIISIKNVGNCSDAFHLYIPGMYGVFAINAANQTQQFYFEIYRLYPQTGLFVPGMVFLSIGVVTSIIRKLFKDRKFKNPIV